MKIFLETTIYEPIIMLVSLATIYEPIIMLVSFDNLNGDCFCLLINFC